MLSNSDDSVSELLADLKTWAADAERAGWLSAQTIAGINDLHAGRSADLFGAGDQAPLVVALFGGTGVGKSSLLNALVGKEIAKVGVIRPTSLEATVYAHQDVEFDAPDRFLRAPHSDDARRHLVWVDMPDIDSTASTNRELVIEFLPYVDVLVYVVSPERYRDEAPWALLREQVDKSAWVFVMNQFDRGSDSQFDDLQQVLTQAGFEDPVVLRTSAVAEIRNDELGRLADVIDELSQSRVRAVIQAQAQSARRGEAAALLARAVRNWPADETALFQAWAVSKQRLREELTGDLVARLAPVAARMADAAPVEEGELWDQWSSDRFADAITQAALEAGANGWTATALQPLRAIAGTDNGLELDTPAEATLRRSVSKSLAKPGSSLQRGLHAGFEKLIYLLPLAALGWVGWHVFAGFYQGTQGDGRFIGDGFAINALLLVLLAGAAPYLCARLLRPSAKRAALRGIKSGLEELLELLDARVVQVIQQLAQQLRGLQDAQQALQARAALDSAPAGDATTQRYARRLRPRKTTALDKTLEPKAN